MATRASRRWLVASPKLCTPSFKEPCTRFQFAPVQGLSNKAIASERYVVECHFSRVAVMKLVDHVIPRERFAAAHHGWIFANARTMWLAPLKQPHTCPHGMAFKSLGIAYLWGLESDNA